MQRPKPVVLLTMSGIGVSPSIEGNAVRLFELPGLSALVQAYPSMTLEASGPAVGLSEGEGGSAEAGHRTIGLGRPWFSSEARIDRAVKDGIMQESPGLKKTVSHLRRTRGTLHLVGLLSYAEICAKRAHVYALLSYLKERGLDRVVVHAILDGVDANPKTGIDLIRELETKMSEIGVGHLASVSGRRFAMDDDSHWDRTETAYRAMALGLSASYATTAESAVVRSYEAGIFDEELLPVSIASSPAQATRYANGDAVLFWNTRPHGMRQLLKAFSLPAFSAFERPDVLDGFIATLAMLDADLPVEIAYPPDIPETCLGSVISNAGLRQLRLAETERFAHVTVFLNGMTSDVFPGEDHLMLPSPHVSSYDQCPDMGMFDVGNAAVKAIAGGDDDVIIVNLAGPDMVARTGHEEATEASSKTMDIVLRRIVEAALAVGGVVLAVGDHGRAESLRDPATGRVRTSGTCHPVPFLVIGKSYEGLKALSGDAIGGDLSKAHPAGSLADVAPTMLKILDLPIPKEMTGRPLV